MPDKPLCSSRPTLSVVIPAKPRQYLVLAVVGAVAAVFAAIKLLDPDCWWHLACGRLFWEQGLQTTNTFSSTFPDYPWHHTQWLFDAVLRALEAAGGLAAVEALQIVLVAAAFVLVADTMRRETGSLHPAPVFLLILPALSASWVRFVPRPQLVTYVGLALLLNLWERRSKRLALWFFIAAAAWANCHAGVAFGLATAVVLPTASLLGGKLDEARRGGLSAGAFFLGSLLSPNGLYPYTYALEHLSVKEIVPLGEFMPPTLAGDLTFFALAALAVALLPSRMRRGDYIHALLLALFLSLALGAVRIIPKFIIVILPGLYVGLEELRTKLAGYRRGKAATMLLLTASAFLVAGLVWRDARAVFDFNEWGIGANERYLPRGAADFIERLDLEGGMYNDFRQGGYLIWRLYPRRRVFQDGRVQAYPASFLRGIIESFRKEMAGEGSRGAWSSLVETWGLDYAVTERNPYEGGGESGKLFERLGWPLVYLDGISAVFVRPLSVNDAKTAAARFALIRYTDPAIDLAVKGERDPVRMIADLGRIDPRRLIRPEDFNRFAAAASGAGDPRLGERLLRGGLAFDPDNQGLRFNLASLLVQAGRPAEGKAELRETVRRGVESPIGRRAAGMLRELP